MGAKDPIPTAESLRRTTERLRSDRCMHWMDAENEDACVLAGEGNDRSSGRICIWMHMCQEGQKEFAAGSWTDERLHAVNHLHVVAAATEFYRATVRSSDGASNGSNKDLRRFVQFACTYGVLLVGCSQGRLFGNHSAAPSVCTSSL